MRAEFTNEIKNLRAEFTDEIKNIRSEFTDEIKKVREEFITKEVFEAKINQIRAEIKTEIARLDKKFTIMFLILLFAIIFLNQNALEFLAKIFGLLK